MVVAAADDELVGGDVLGKRDAASVMRDVTGVTAREVEISEVLVASRVGFALFTMTSSSNLSSSSFNDYNNQIQGSALKATRAAVSLPADIPFHRSVHPEFARRLDKSSARVLSLTNKLLGLSHTANASASSRGKGKARLEAQDDVVDNFHSLVVDAMDQLLENAVSGYSK